MKKVRAVHKNAPFMFNTPTYPAMLLDNGQVAVYTKSAMGSDNYSSKPTIFASIKEANEVYMLYDVNHRGEVIWKSQ